MLREHKAGISLHYRKTLGEPFPSNLLPYCITWPQIFNSTQQAYKHISAYWGTHTPIHARSHTKTYPLCRFPVLSDCLRPLTVFEPWPCHIRVGPKGKRGIHGVSILHGGCRGKLDPQTKAPVVAGVYGSKWVMGQPHTLTLFLSLAFFSSISLSLFNGEEDPRGTMAFFCPHYHPNSGDAYWTGATPSQGVPLAA